MNRVPLPEEALFADALAQPPAERGAFLAKACGANVDLLARLITLVAAHEGPESLLRVSAPPREIFHEEKAGDSIGHYKLLQKIGEGGCGVVWMAEQEEPVRRRVALKVIKLGMDTKAVVARFEAERQALAMMDHPCIAKVHDAGSTDTGRPFFVMELVRGIPITKYCDENHLTPKERLELFIKVCQAIQHAHQKGVIHRDIKPSNILVTVNDGAPTPKVIDFGIAKATQGRLTDATVFTAFEQFIGTPVYMSPEQAEMSSLDIDTRSDIYSLGVLLYELLTGRPPFDPKAFAQAGVDQIRQHIRERDPAKPSRRLGTMEEGERTTIAKLRNTAPAQLSLLLSGDLDWIIMRCLEKDRTRRYDTANGLAMDIQRYLRNEPVVARPPSTAYMLQKLIRRNRVAFMGLTAVAATLVGGAAVSTWQAVKARQAERKADAARVNEASLRRTSEQQELATRQRAYAADMNLVQEALSVENLDRARELLFRHRLASGQTDLRGWEWRYLWQFCRSDPRNALSQKQSSIASLSISSDGNWVAIGEWLKGGLSVRNLRTGYEYSVAAGSGRVTATFSPREPLLAFTGCEPDPGSTQFRFFVRLWNPVERRIEREIELPGRSGSWKFFSLDFSDDGQRFVVCNSHDDTVTIWQTRTGKKLSSLRIPQPSAGLMAHGFAVTRDLRLAAHQTPDHQEICVIELPSGIERWRAVAAKEVASALAFSPDGKLLASSAAYAESAIRLWDVATGSEIGRLEGHHAWVPAMVFTADGQTLVSASGDQTIRIWDVRSRRLIKTLRGHQREVYHLALLPDNRTIVSGGKDGSVRLWDASELAESLAQFVAPEEILTWSFRPAGRAILALEADGTVVERKGPAFRERTILFKIDGVDIRQRTASFFSVARFSVDQRFLALALPGKIQIWDLHRRARTTELSVGTDYAVNRPAFDSPTPVAFLANNSRMIVCDMRHRRYREFELTSGTEISSWAGPEEFTPNGCAVDPDERTCLMIGFDGEGIIRDLASASIRKFALPVRETVDLRFSMDGRVFVTSSQLGLAQVWESTTEREVASLKGHLLGPFSTAFLPDLTRLVTGGSGLEALRVWDLGSRQQVLTLPADGSIFRQTSFSPDGNAIGSLSLDGRLHVFQAPSWEEIAAEDKRVETGGSRR